MKGRYISMQKSTAISEHLKTVEVKCKAVGLNVVKVLKFLCTFGICKTTSDFFHLFLNLNFALVHIKERKE
jgi:hypothetical protein